MVERRPEALAKEVFDTLQRPDPVAPPLMTYLA